jgi:hypothetical protein
VVFALTVAVALWYALQGHARYLGHDEAVYATKARSWLTGAPAAQWGLYRPVALPALGWAALAVRDSVGAVRFVGLVLALATLGITYFVAARLTTPRRAAVVLLLVVGGWGFVRHLPEFLNDIGTAGLQLLTAYLIVRSRQRPESGALPAAGVVAVAAFYLRYGAVSGLLVMAVAALVTWGWRAWTRSWRQVGVAAAIVVCGLVPLLVYSDRVTGSPMAVLLTAQRAARPAYIGEGLIYYARVFPFRLSSDLGGVIMAAGLIAAGLAATRLMRGQPGRPGDRVRVFFGLTAALYTFVLGISAHGEERYVLFPVLLLTILGVDAVAGSAGQWSSFVLAAVAVLATLITVADYRATNDRFATVTAERMSLVSVARELSARHEPCLVVTNHQPEIGWYSGCATAPFPNRNWRPSGDQWVHIVLFEHGSDQPSVAELRALLRGRRWETTELATKGSLGRALIVTLPPTTR